MINDKEKMTHNELVKLAGLWLQEVKGCNPIFMEKGSDGCTERPDAIGWTTTECIIVECKTSKEDLLVNNKKILCLGNRKYFLMTNELYNKCQDKITEGWGVVTVDDIRLMPRQVRLKDSKFFERDLISEMHYLRSRILAIQYYGRV